MVRQVWFLGWAMSAASALLGCTTHYCTQKGCVVYVEVALVDDAGDPVAARGEIRYTNRRAVAFDCTVAPTATVNDVDCENGTVQMEPVYNEGDQLEIRFEPEDGSFSDWQPVPLTVGHRVFADFNGDDCDCTALEGRAQPVTVPANAQLRD
jgi:hypothetical protein